MVAIVSNSFDPQSVNPQSPAGNILISQFDYTNDDAGKRIGRDDSGTAFASTQQNTFGYNARNEVTSAAMRNGTSIYNFDQIGNRSSAAVPAAVSSPGGIFDYTTNGLNQYTSISPANPATPAIPAFDDDGNLTYDGIKWHFTWNGENRMVEIRDYDENPVDGSVRILNTFDSQGRRAQSHRRVFPDLWTLTSDFRYFYDGWNLIYEIDVLAANPEPTYYVWGLDLSQSLQGAGGVGGLLMILEDTNAWAPTYDANGNISEYINLANGNVDAHLEYDAFGRKIVSIGNAPSNFGFSTKYEDVETGYLYYGFRFYDPQTGRWPNRDPIGERGGLNLYSFVNNEPTGWVDALGLMGHKNSKGEWVSGGGEKTREAREKRNNKPPPNPAIPRPVKDLPKTAMDHVSPIPLDTVNPDMHKNMLNIALCTKAKIKYNKCLERVMTGQECGSCEKEYKEMQAACSY